MQVKQGSTYSKGVRFQVVIGENIEEGRKILERGTKGQHVVAYEDGTRGIGA